MINMLGASYPSKKELKANIGKPLRYIETSMFGAEYKDNGKLIVVGPCPHTNRKWFANIEMVNGLIAKVK